MCLKSLQCVLLWPRLHFISTALQGHRKGPFTHSIIESWINSGSVNSKKSSNKSRGSYRGSTNSFNQQKWCLTFKFPRLPTMFPPKKGAGKTSFRIILGSQTGEAAWPERWRLVAVTLPYIKNTTYSKAGKFFNMYIRFKYIYKYIYIYPFKFTYISMYIYVLGFCSRLIRFLEISCYLFLVK